MLQFPFPLQKHETSTWNLFAIYGIVIFLVGLNYISLGVGYGAVGWGVGGDGREEKGIREQRGMK